MAGWFWIVGSIGLLALLLVGAAAVVEVRPILRERKQKREEIAAWHLEATQLYIGARLAHTHARSSSSSGLIVGMILGMLLMMFGGWEWSKFDFKGEWPEVRGLVLDTRYEPSQSSDEPIAVIQFAYSIYGVDYTDVWIANAESDFLTGGNVHYQTGDLISVWYHPDFPSFPTLGRVTLWYVVLILAAGGYLLLRSSLALLGSVVWPASAARAQKQ
jgi:hypothetical protein